MTMPVLLPVARGDAPADLVLTNARVVNVFTREVVRANVALHAGRIAGVGDYTSGREVIDLAGAFLAPGFIDAHMHVESTFLPPSQFARLAVPHGTTGAVFDPHEIANVLGVPGIRWVMDEARGVPMHAMFTLSSCVPSSALETSGTRLEAADLATFFGDPRVVGLAEVMNYPGVVAGDAGLLAKIKMGLSRGVVDGHAPGLRGRALNAYASTGISSDHECTTAVEAIEKARLGMCVFIREGSAARNLDALLPAVTRDNAHRFAFCTDDRHPADLVHEGHIDHVVRRAIARGLDPMLALAMASWHAARHYRQWNLGAIAPGYWADLVVFDDLLAPRPRMVLCLGRLVACDGVMTPDPSPERDPPPKPPHAPVRLPTDLSEASFAIPAPGPARTIRVIGMDPTQLVTTDVRVLGKVERGQYVADADRDLLKIVVIERHRGTGNIGRGFVRGFAFRGGALASTVGHDSHNLAIVGDTDADMLAAARALAAASGGQCVVSGGVVRALLPLPIAGLMSDQPAEVVISQQRELLAAARALGCPHPDPFMPLSFLPLPVIPHLKVTDLGLVDVDRFEVVALEV